MVAPLHCLLLAELDKRNKACIFARYEVLTKLGADTAAC